MLLLVLFLSLCSCESVLSFMTFSTFADSFSTETLSTRVATMYSSVTRESPMVLCVQGLYDSNTRALFQSSATQLFGAPPYSPQPSAAQTQCGCPSALAEYAAFSTCASAAFTGGCDAQCAVSACEAELAALLTASDATGAAQSCHACLATEFQTSLPSGNLTASLLACEDAQANVSRCQAYGAHTGVLLYVRSGLLEANSVEFFTLNASTATYLARGGVHARVAPPGGVAYEVTCAGIAQDPQLEMGASVQYYGEMGSFEAENAAQARALRERADARGGARRVVLAAMGCGKGAGTPGFPIDGFWETGGCATALAEEVGARTCLDGGYRENAYCDWFFESNFMRQCTHCEPGKNGYVLDHAYVHGVDVEDDPLYDDKKYTPLVAIDAVSVTTDTQKKGLVGYMTVKDSKISAASQIEGVMV